MKKIIKAILIANIILFTSAIFAQNTPHGFSIPNDHRVTMFTTKGFIPLSGGKLDIVFIYNNKTLLNDIYLSVWSSDGNYYSDVMVSDLPKKIITDNYCEVEILIPSSSFSRGFDFWSNFAHWTIQQTDDFITPTIIPKQTSIPLSGGIFKLDYCAEEHLIHIITDADNNYYNFKIGIGGGDLESVPYEITIPPSGTERAINLKLLSPYALDTYISVNQSDNPIIEDPIIEPISITPSNQNYIITAKPFTANSNISVTDINTSAVNVVYYDGLGRPMQEVAAGQSPNRKDIVRPIVYDQFGHEAQAFLPYERTGTAGAYTSNTLAEQLTFYNSQYSADAPYAFSKTQYDNSPLNRVTAQTAPGDKWKASSVKIVYSTNTATEVKLWKTDATGNPYHSNAKYSEAQLYITETEDENGVKTREYKDKQGQVVETRQNALATSYIYDNFGLLRAVIPPKAQDMAVTAAEFKELIYQYSYDTRNRVIEKKIPGMELQYMVYDNRDRVVMSQDGNLKATGRWRVHFYDALNRPVAEGTVKSTLVRSTLQGYWNNKEANQTRSAGTYTLTTVAGMPAAEAVLSYTYYDDYTWGASVYTTGDFASAAPANITPKGQVTGTKVKVLDGSEYAVGTWLTSTVYYDFMYRPIQTHTSLYTGGKATVSTNYTFDGLPERIKEVQTFSGPPTTINQRFVYDGARRATHVYHAINGASEILVTHNTYDNLGRLNAKKQGNGEAVTTKYNIRGWIEKSTAGKFNYELDYNLNGNIRTQKWNHGASDNVYSYAYDAYNRLLSGTTPGFGENLIYDANGNIIRLVRTGGTEAGTYNYTYSGNRLIVLNGNAYEYDANGNAKKDGLRGFNIEYNLLNLPRKVSKGTGSLEYIYDAAGSKLAKKLDGAFVNYYCGSVVYTGSKAVEYVAHPEGIAHKSGSGFSYQYNQTDHLGNVRSVADASKAVVQATDYFPFGLAHSTSNLAKNKYLYNGKELQNDVVGGTPFGQLDYGARLYDATLGVWRNIDPLAEKSRRWSPYVYCFNNPLRFVDPDGRAPGDFWGKDFWGREKVLGNDGINDNKVYVMKKGGGEGKKFVKENSGKTKAFQDNKIAYTNSIEIEGSADARQAMVDEVSKDDGRGGTADANNREYGGSVTNGVVTVEAPGAVADMKTADAVSISLPTGVSTFHSHPSGSVAQTTTDPSISATSAASTIGGTTYRRVVVQTPSKVDIEAAGVNTHYVFGRSSKKVYIYNSEGVQATIRAKYFVTPFTPKK